MLASNAATRWRIRDGNTSDRVSGRPGVSAWPETAGHSGPKLSYKDGSVAPMDPFRIDVPQADLDELRHRLGPDPVAG